jgi:hypothetical protein
VDEYVDWMRDQTGTDVYLAEAERVMRQQNVIQQAVIAPAV